MTEITTNIINFFRELLNNDILTIIIIALLPIIELRGAIPVAFSFGMAWYESYFYSWLGSSLVVPILLLLLMPLLNAMKKCKGFRSLANAVESVFKDKASKIKTKADASVSEKHALWRKMIGVFAFVAVPLPLTGVWTGSAVAVFLGLKFWQAFPVILLGNLTAGAIMTILCKCFADYVDIILTVFMILVVVIVVFYIIMLVVKMVKNKKKGNNKTDSVDAVENVTTEVVEDSITKEDNNSNVGIVDDEEGDDTIDHDDVQDTPQEDDALPTDDDVRQDTKNASENKDI